MNGIQLGESLTDEDFHVGSNNRGFTRRFKKTEVLYYRVSLCRSFTSIGFVMPKFWYIRITNPKVV